MAVPKAKKGRTPKAVPADGGRSRPHAKRVQPVERETERWTRIARKVGYRLPDFLRRCGVSQRTFERKMAERGRTPEAWLAEQRFHVALKLLAEGEMTVKNVALALGYKQCSHFCRQFKAFADVTPSQYQAKYANWHKWHKED